MPHKDPDRRREYNREYNRTHPEVVRAIRERRREKANAYNKRYRDAVGSTFVRQYSKRIRETLGCASCGEKSACCLDFHHIDPSVKKDRPSRLTAKELADEISGCVVLCKNCHSKLHAGLLDGCDLKPIDASLFPPPKSRLWGSHTRGLALVAQDEQESQS